MVEEVAWYEAFDCKLLGVVLLDKTDTDFNYIVLGRDANHNFRCIDGDSCYNSKSDAENELVKCLLKYKDDGQDCYPQGDERGTPNDILNPCVDDDKLHKHFKILLHEPRYEAARNLIKEIAYTFVDVDGNYIKEFQTHGFDARLWELYLYVYLHNAGFEIIRDHPSPDYHISFFGEELFIEAVTVNPSQPNSCAIPLLPENHEDAIELNNDYMPIRFGSSLFTKLRMKYWEKEHVTNKPLILAIHDFHMPGSMTWSRTALSDYLYGVRSCVTIDEQGNSIPTLQSIHEHSWQDKTIPSGFFKLPEANNISAVLFSNAATITKFNRMGKLARLGSSKVKMYRKGFLFDPHPTAIEPLPFCWDVDSPDYEESWSDSLVMFHNPCAKFPVPPHIFTDISHVSFEEEIGFSGYFQPYDVLSSITVLCQSQDDINE